jgi:ADP-ribosylglycohydrolase
MTLAVGEALLAAQTPFTSASIEPPLRAKFIDWLISPENNRAPGMSCMQACEGLKAGEEWLDATVAGSKGCGANMRVAPVALLSRDLPGMSERTRSEIAQFQAVMTHGHPTALAAADLTCVAIHELLLGAEPVELLQLLRDYAVSQRHVYHEKWLGTLWNRSSAESPEEFIETGWEECIHSLDRVEIALANLGRHQDPCEETGEGWVAEEALATALLCFLLTPENPVATIRRAAVTTGDSDSIATIAGALAGAYIGPHAWPQEWIDQIEYHDRLKNLAEGLSSAPIGRGTGT